MKMLLYGFGGHARVLADSLEAMGIAIAGVFDNNPATKTPYPFFGRYSPEEQPDCPLLLAMGNNQVRRRLSNQIQHKSGQLLHPSAVYSSKASLGEGSIVLQRAIVQTAATIGRHVIINSGAIVEHDCRLEDFVHVGPGAVLCGQVVVGEGSFIGAGAVVLPGIRIGKECVVGAGAVVCKVVADGQKVAGNPARVL